MLKPFRFWCQKVLPLVYDDSLSYYELLCKVVDYVNHLNEDVTTLSSLVESLDLDAIRQDAIDAAESVAETKVDEYLDSGVVEAKIDELVESGYFSEIIRELARDWLYPEDYGAVGDGITDDAAALSACFTAANTLRIPVRLKKNYFINSTVNVPSYVIIKGLAKNEYAPKVICGQNCNLAFNCTGIANTIEGFIITNYENVYRNCDGIKLIGNAQNNVDSTVKDMQIAYLDTAIEVLGRNVDVLGGLISHCRVGVHFNVPDAQMRGLNVDGVRFHGIGEEASLPWFYNSYCVLIEQNYYSNLTIRNCIADQSGTFFKGYATQAQISNNYIECFAKTIFDIGSDETTGIGNTGTIMIADNYISGKRGAVSVDYSVEYPDHLVEIKNFTRVSFTGNVFRFSYKSCFLLDYARSVNIVGNTFTGIGMNGTDNYAVEMDTNSIVTFESNVATTTVIYACKGTSGSTIYIRDNVAFAYVSEPAFSIGEEDQYALLGSVSSGAALPFSLPNEFYVRTGDGQTAWKISKIGSYFTAGVTLDADNTFLYVLRVFYDGDDIKTKYSGINLSTAAETEFTATLFFYKKQN